MTTLNQDIYSLKLAIHALTPQEKAPFSSHEALSQLAKISRIALPLLKGLDTLFFHIKCINRCFSLITGYCIALKVLPFSWIYSHNHVIHLAARLTAKQITCLQMMRLNPDDASSYFNLALSLTDPHRNVVIGNKPWNQKSLYLEAIRLNPNLAAAYLYLGNTLSAGDCITLLDGSVMIDQDLYHKVIDLCPKELDSDLNPILAEAYLNLGVTLSDEETISLDGLEMTNQDLYYEAIDLNPHLAEAYLNLGSSLSQDETATLLDNRVMTSRELYLKALKLDPSLGEAYFNLAGHLLPNETVTLNGITYSEKTLYLKCIELEYAESEAYFDLGTLLEDHETITLNNGSQLTKQALYLKAIEKDRDFLDAYFNLALTLSDQETVTLSDGIPLNQQKIALKMIDLDASYQDAYHLLIKTFSEDQEDITLLNETVLSRDELLKKVPQQPLQSKRKSISSSFVKKSPLQME